MADRRWVFRAGAIVAVVAAIGLGYLLLRPRSVTKTILIVDANAEADVFGAMSFEMTRDGWAIPVAPPADQVLVVSRRTNPEAAVIQISAGDTYRWLRGGRSVLGFTWLALQKTGEVDLGKTNRELAAQFGIVQDKPTAHLSDTETARLLSNRYRVDSQ